MVDTREKALFTAISTVFGSARNPKQSQPEFEPGYTTQIIIRDGDQEYVLEKLEIIGVDVEMKQMDIADYVILDEDRNVLAIIERKTYSDAASSIIDGRAKEQIEKMDKLQEVVKEKTNIEPKIHYIIEGKFWGNLDKPVKRKSRMTASTIQRYGDSLRDKGYIVDYTYDPLHTATRLHDICQRYGNNMKRTLEGAGLTLEDASKLCKPKKEVADRKQILEMWQAIPGIGKVKAVKYFESNSLYDWVDGKIKGCPYDKDILKCIFGAKKGISVKKAKNNDCESIMHDMRAGNKVGKVYSDLHVLMQMKDGKIQQQENEDC